MIVERMLSVVIIVVEPQKILEVEKVAYTRLYVRKAINKTTE